MSPTQTTTPAGTARTDHVRLSLVDGHASIDGNLVEPVDGLTPEQAAVAAVARTAATAGHPVRALVTDDDGTTMTLLVHPDGTSELLEPTDPDPDLTDPTDPDAEPADLEPAEPEPVERVVLRPAGAASSAAGLPAAAETALAGQGSAAHTRPPQSGVGVAPEQPHTAGRRPSAANLLVDAPEPVTARAREGWRGALVRATGLPLAPGTAERRREEHLRTAQTQLSGPRTILVVNPKGGVGKTTSTLLLAAALGVARGGGVLAWDNNETRGTMALRSVDAGHGGDVRTLLAAAPQLTSTAGRLGDLDAHMHHQRGVRFDVLPSQTDPTGTGVVDAQDFTALHALVTRFYRLVLVDTGNNIRAANWQAAARAADQLLITTTVREDSATSAAWMLDALAEGEHAHLLSGAVTLLHDPAPRTSTRLRTRLADHFAAATGDTSGDQVLHMPYEPSLAAGGRIDHEALSRTGQRAWLRAAATVVDQLATRAHQVPHP